MNGHFSALLVVDLHLLVEHPILLISLITGDFFQKKFFMGIEINKAMVVTLCQ